MRSRTGPYACPGFANRPYGLISIRKGFRSGQAPSLFEVATCPYTRNKPPKQEPPSRAISRPQGRLRYDEAQADSSKYSRVTLNTIGASKSRPIRLGTAISPFSVSDKFQTKATFTFAKPSAASTHKPR